MDVSRFQHEASRTIRINWEHENGPDIAILGAIGELGSMASVFKKKQRDQDAYSHFKEHFAEEIGDTLWYVVIMANRMNITFDHWPSLGKGTLDVFQLTYSLFDQIHLLHKQKELLFKQYDSCQTLVNLYHEILSNLQYLAQYVGQDLSRVADHCINKTLSYWGHNLNSPTIKFDKGFPQYEQLPREFKIEFLPLEVPNTTIMRMNGVQLGDRLTDNSYEDDGYRFHDVFHIAGVGLLGWSPVFRGLLKAKRKSNKQLDEVEDGARAAIIEEAIINHIYDFARPDFLKDISRIDLALIKRVQSLVKGYEVSKCEPWEWQHCIIEGYRIFRELKEAGSGILEVDAENRSLKLLPYVQE